MVYFGPAGGKPCHVLETAFSEMFAAEAAYGKVIRYHTRQIHLLAFHGEIDYRYAGVSEFADGR